MTREEFLRRRKSGIGGSDVAAILGCSKWRTARDVWRDKTTDEVAEESSDILQLASYLEEYTAQRYAERTGHKVRRKNIEIVHPKYSFLKGNVDREILLDDRGVGVLECKALSTYNFRRVKMYGLPDDYICQLQHYFLCSGGRYKWGEYAVLNRDSGELLIIGAVPDPKFMQMAEAACVDFWERCVEGGEEPLAVTAGTAKAVTLPPKFEGEIKDLDGDLALAGLLRQRVESRALADEAKELLEAVDSQIREHLGGIEAAECAGYRIYYRSSSRTTLDSAAIRKELPDVFAKYSKTSTAVRSLKFYAINE